MTIRRRLMMILTLPTIVMIIGLPSLESAATAAPPASRVVVSSSRTVMTDLATLPSVAGVHESPCDWAVVSSVCAVTKVGLQLGPLAGPKIIWHWITNEAANQAYKAMSGLVHLMADGDYWLVVQMGSSIEHSLTPDFGPSWFQTYYGQLFGYGIISLLLCIFATIVRAVWITHNLRDILLAPFVIVKVVLVGMFAPLFYQAMVQLANGISVYGNGKEHNVLGSIIQVLNPQVLFKATNHIPLFGAVIFIIVSGIGALIVWVIELLRFVGIDIAMMATAFMVSLEAASEEVRQHFRRLLRTLFALIFSQPVIGLVLGLGAASFIHSKGGLLNLFLASIFVLMAGTSLPLMLKLFDAFDHSFAAGHARRLGGAMPVRALSTGGTMLSERMRSLKTRVGNGSRSSSSSPQRLGNMTGGSSYYSPSRTAASAPTRASTPKSIASPSNKVAIRSSPVQSSHQPDGTGRVTVTRWTPPRSTSFPDRAVKPRTREVIEGKTIPSITRSPHRPELSAGSS